MKRAIAWLKERIRSPWTWVVIAAAVLLIIPTLRDDEAGLDYDPRNTGRYGTSAAVELLEELGSDVQISKEISGDTVVVFRNALADEQVDELEDWVRTGGTLVLTDGNSNWAESATTEAPLRVLPRTLSPKCDQPWVQGIDQITPGSQDYPVFDTTGGDVTGCFNVNATTAFVVEYAFDLGSVIEVGTTGPFTNENLDETDNAVLLAAITGAGSGSITVLEEDPTLVPAGGEQSIIDLVPEWVFEALAQLMLAIVVYALWRGRRLGDVVTERRPVEVPASTLTLAVGELLRVADRSDAAAKVLRADARRRLSILLGVPASTDAQVLASLIAGRTGIDELRLRALLDGRVQSGEALLRLAQELEKMQREVAHVR